MLAKTAAQLVGEAKVRVESLSPDQVVAELTVSDPLLVDLRELDEWIETGTIAGAIHAPRGMIEFYADATSAFFRQEFDPGRRTIVFCASGGRAALAARTLQQMGYANVAHLGKGLRDWSDHGFPLTRPSDRG
jgi:rhodanese-related sulfurtransferase